MNPLMSICRNPYFIGINSAIKQLRQNHGTHGCRNPYFIGINSAIGYVEIYENDEYMSQSLFYWN